MMNKSKKHIDQLYRGRIISRDATLSDALKLMDELDKKLLIALEVNKFIGLLSIGDIQRAIIKNLPLNTHIISILRKNIRIANPSDSIEKIKKMMLEFRMELCPVVDETNKIIKVYYWEDLFVDQKIKPNKKFDLPVVIMAGGLGSRLKPLTNVLPKPLIPIYEKTMLEEIFDRFSEYGCKEFYVSVNYKSDLIEYYIKNQELPFKISFIRESEPLGTAGSLSLFKDKFNQTIFISNCDILIDQDYSEILDYHRENKNKITVVAALKHYSIPYGTLVTGDNGALESLDEKPELTIKINSGMYIIEPDIIDIIPRNKHFHITQLILNVKNNGGSVGVYPVSEKSWIDLGMWKEYMKYF